MILNRFVRIQLALFAVVSLIATLVLAVVYLRVPAALGIGRTSISAEFTGAARLYPRAEVTYLGRSIGSVQELHLVPGGVRIDMRVDASVGIPDDATAHARSLSAVGEQFVDIVPGPGPAAELGDGGVIPVARTTVPVEIGTVLDGVDALVAALPGEELNTVVDETHDAFLGVGDDLGRLLDDGRLLLEAAQADIDPTLRLIEDAGPLLDTQTATAEEIRVLVASLARVTAQLRASEPDIRGLLDEGPGFARDVGGLLDDITPTLPRLLDTTLPVAEVLRTYNANIEQVLVTYPALNAAIQSAILPHGDRNQASVDILATVGDPPPCLEGFVPAEEWRDPADTSVAPARTVYCTAPPDSDRVVRGARNLPCPGRPGVRGASPADCRDGAVEPDGAAAPPATGLPGLLQEPGGR